MFRNGKVDSQEFNLDNFLDKQYWWYVTNFCLVWSHQFQSFPPFFNAFKDLSLRRPSFPTKTWFTPIENLIEYFKYFQFLDEQKPPPISVFSHHHLGESCLQVEELNLNYILLLDSLNLELTNFCYCKGLLLLLLFFTPLCRFFSFLNVLNGWFKVNLNFKLHTLKCFPSCSSLSYAKSL